MERRRIKMTTEEMNILEKTYLEGETELVEAEDEFGEIWIVEVEKQEE